MKFTLPNGEVKTITLQPSPEGGYVAHIGDQQIAVTVLQQTAHTLLLEAAGQHWWVQYAATDSAQYIHIQGHTLRLEQAAAAEGKRKTADKTDLSASMPGQVIDVLVEEGDTVTKGQTLVLLEAMKMELRIKAAKNGRVRQVLCRVGDAVERGQTLVELH